MTNAKDFDLTQLLEEFADFQPDEPFSSMDGKPFLQAMAHPEPEFVIPFIEKRTDRGSDQETAKRDLYAFLLEKRYFLKLNLLYFAFDVFCGSVALPDEILDMTPFPHEDGAPLFKNKLIPGYRIE